jgi:gas vesicle protein
MKSIFNFLSGFFWGFTICGGITLIMTPHTGEEFQKIARTRFNELSSEWQKLREEHRSRLEAELVGLKGEA